MVSFNTSSVSSAASSSSLASEEEEAAELTEDVLNDTINFDNER